MTIPALCLADLQQIDNEPRLHDLRLAKRLGYANPPQIRELIKRNLKRLERYGSISCDTKNPGPEGGRPGKEYWLNKRQAIRLTTLAETEFAEEATAEIIEVFVAWHEGKLQPKPGTQVVWTDGAVREVLAGVGIANSTANLALATADRAEKKADRALKLVVINKNPAPKTRQDNVKLWQQAGRKASTTKSKHQAKYGVDLDDYGWSIDALRADLIAKYNAGIDRWGQRISSIDDLQLDQMNPDDGFDYRSNHEWVHMTSNTSKQNKTMAEYSQYQAEDEPELPF